MVIWIQRKEVNKLSFLGDILTTVNCQ